MSNEIVVIETSLGNIEFELVGRFSSWACKKLQRS